MADRKAEIERKKAQLIAMRESRMKEDAKKKDQVQAPPETRPALDKLDADDILNTLGIDTTASASKSNAISENGVASGVHGTPLATSGMAVGAAAAAASVCSSSGSSLAGSMRSRRPKLTLSSVNQTNIPPRQSIAYDKEVQTVLAGSVVPKDRDALTPQHRRAGSPKFVFHPHLEWEDEFGQGFDTVLVYDQNFDDVEHADGEAPMGGSAHASPSGARRRRQHSSVDRKTNDDDSRLADGAPTDDLPGADVLPPQELTAEQKDQLMRSDDFMRFFGHASRVLERALAEFSDVDVDYSGVRNDDAADDGRSGERIKIGRRFHDDRWSRGRCVSSLDWSCMFPELLLTSYRRADDSPSDPDGVCLVWNIRYKKDTPEYVFQCQSEVTSACFTKFHQNLIVGGTYSGLIVMWDNRTHRKTPVYRTPLSSTGHTHPVYCVNVVGTQNAHNLVSISRDGKLCSWTLDMLSQPQESMSLNYRHKPIATTCCAFFNHDVNNFLVGTEEGPILPACRHGNKMGVLDDHTLEGHYGPVTALDCHAVAGHVDFSHLLLSSGFDWSVKLWNAKEQRCLCSFDNYSDYTTDVQWSPVHPALFASCDCSGRLDLWNLNSDTQIPLVSVQQRELVESYTSALARHGGAAATSSGSAEVLSKLRWHQTGQHLAAGDECGSVFVYDVADSVALPRGDEWSRLAKTLKELQATAQDKRAQQPQFSLGASAALLGAAPALGLPAGATSGSAPVLRAGPPSASNLLRT